MFQRDPATASVFFRITTICLFVLMPGGVAGGDDAVPFPDSLESAAISVERLDRMREDALLIGNGDVNALLRSAPAELRMMLTKNDVWDARLITANDPPLPKLRWIKQAAAELSPGGNTEIHEGGFRTSRRDGYHDDPYPFPKPCAQLAFGDDAAARCWRLVRVGGSQDAFLLEDSGAVMRVAGSVTEGCPAWHGNHTLNYNAQQTFWSAFVSNHVELSEPYVRLIDRYMTRARWLCQQLFEFDGAYIPHVMLAHEPIDPAQCGSRNGRQYIHHVWGFTMGVSAFAVQNLWHRYKYAPDRGYLERTAYPAIRDVAIFQANFMDQCEGDAVHPEKVILTPSVSPEHWGWTKNLERNRDSTFDIAMFRFVFQAAIEGAKRLECDETLVSRWEECVERLPDYPTTGDDEPVVVDVRDAPPIRYNIAIPAVPVLPGDQVTWLSSDQERTLLARSIDRLQWNGNNSSVIMSVARARLSMPDSIDVKRTTVPEPLKPNGTLGINRAGSGINGNGHYTEQFAATMAVSELLLQSVGDVIRVFPIWPKERFARFVNLRTQGGFLVAAEQVDGRVGPVTVTSTVGGTLRLVSPWDAVEVERNGQRTAVAPDERGVVHLVTRPGERLVFHSPLVP